MLNIEYLGHTVVDLAQKQKFAPSITELHSTTFTTPSLFVNIRFVPAEPTGDFFVAAKPVEPTSPNRVFALVRMGADRTKAQFNNLAGKIEKSWNEIVSYDDNLHVETVEDKEKKLHITWLRDNMAYFKERAEVSKNEKFADMLEEIEHRSDLYAAL
ncbi:hypothetical protein CFAM422_007024 [Trichoderma lentiforme]|uniref:Tautomerase cis-CaaD-like domain-containing protein n=1 Tax=Trichoderma lentiforme TaxID=1567552 RepID=A0A9P4XEJ4_9HYPO|nr:hypothetical protein CFAM422_007024 [Trichoderma lentiforme]